MVPDLHNHMFNTHYKNHISAIFSKKETKEETRDPRKYQEWHVQRPCGQQHEPGTKMAF